MGIVDYVITLLSDGGIQADKAWPADVMTLAQVPVAAVSLEEADRKKGTATVMVEMVCNFRSGAAACQRKALEVYEILTNSGASCLQGKCSFDGKSSLFSVPVRAVFYGVAKADSWEPVVKPRVKINAVQLEYLCGCTIERAKDEEYPKLSEAPWQFTLEEFFPGGITEPEEVQDPFTLTVFCNGMRESYHDCVVTQHQRVVEETGIRQIRKGTAAKKTIVIF